MTCIIAWKLKQKYNDPSIWIVGDTKISNNQGVLSKEASKIMSLTIKLKDLSKSHKVYFESTIGFAFAGSSLVAYNVFGVLNHFLANIGGTEAQGNFPTLNSIANKTGKILNFFSSQIQSPCEIFITGKCPRFNKFELYKISLEKNTQGIFVYKIDNLEIDEENPGFYLLGNHKDEIAREIINLSNQLGEEHESFDKVPIHTLRKIIDEKRFSSIGGNLQLGILNASGNFNLCSMWDKDDEKTTKFYHNNIDLYDIIGPNLDDCVLGISGILINRI